MKTNNYDLLLQYLHSMIMIRIVRKAHRAWQDAKILKGEWQKAKDTKREDIAYKTWQEAERKWMEADITYNNWIEKYKAKA